MAGLGLADDILPWTPDSYGQSTEVAPTGGLGLASDPTPAPSPEAAQATIMDIPASRVPAAPGGGIERAPQPGRGDAEAAQRQAAIDKAIGSWDENPIQRLAFVLQAGLAGFAGQKPAWQSALEREEKREQVNLQKALTSIQVIEHVKKTAKGMSPEKRKELIDSSAQQFSMLGEGFVKQLRSLESTGGPDAGAVARAFGSRGKKIMALVGNDTEQALELLKNPELGKQLDAADDIENLPRIAQKLEHITKAAFAAGQADPGFAKFLERYRDPQGNIMLPMSIVRQVNQAAGKGALNESELATMSRRSAEMYSLGILPPDLEVDIAKSAMTQHSDLYKMGQDLKTARANGDYKLAAALEAKLAERAETSRGEIVTLVDPVTGQQVIAERKSERARALIDKGYEIRNDYEHRPREFQDIETGEVVVAMPATLRKLGAMNQFREFDRKTTDIEVRQGDQVFRQQTGGGQPATGYRIIDPLRIAAGQPGAVVRTGEKAPVDPSTAPGSDGPGSAEAAAAPGAAPGGLPSPGGGAPPEPSPLAKETAGPAAPLVEPAPPVDPANARLDAFSRRVAAPAGKVKEVPEKPIDSKTRGEITAGMTLLDTYRRLRELGHLVGDPVKGAKTIVKGAFNPWGILGDSTEDAELRALLNSAAAGVNQTIPGVGTDKDQVLYQIAAVPNRMDPKQTWDATINRSESVVKAMLTDAVAFHKGRGASVPKEIMENLKRYGIDPDGVRKWDGKGDPNAKSVEVAVRGMSDGALQAVAQELLKNRSKFSKTAADAIIREVEMMEAGKRGQR